MRCYVFLSDHVTSLQYIELTGLTCSKVPGFWMVQHQLVFMNLLLCTVLVNNCDITKIQYWWKVATVNQVGLIF